MADITQDPIKNMYDCYFEALSKLSPEKRKAKIFSIIDTCTGNMLVMDLHVFNAVVEKHFIDPDTFQFI